MINLHLGSSVYAKPVYRRKGRDEKLMIQMSQDMERRKLEDVERRAMKDRRVLYKSPEFRETFSVYCIMTEKDSSGL